MSGCCKVWVGCWFLLLFCSATIFDVVLFRICGVFLLFCSAAVSDAMNCKSLQSQFTTVLCKLNQSQSLQVRSVKLLKCWVCGIFFFFSLAYIYSYTFMYPTCHLIQYLILSYDEYSPVLPFPTKESFQPSSFLLIHPYPGYETLPFFELFPARKSRFQKCKQTAHETLNSYPSLTSVSKNPPICCSDSDTCRLKSDCCKNCCSFSWKFLPLLARTTTNYNLGYYEKNVFGLVWDNTPLLQFSAAWAVRVSVP